MATKTISQEMLRAEIRKQLEKAGSQAAFARALKVTPQYINLVLIKALPVGEKLAEKMGYRRILQEPIFEKITAEK